MTMSEGIYKSPMLNLIDFHRHIKKNLTVFADTYNSWLAWVLTFIPCYCACIYWRTLEISAIGCLSQLILLASFRLPPKCVNKCRRKAVAGVIFLVTFFCTNKRKSLVCRAKATYFNTLNRLRINTKFTQHLSLII